MPVDARPADPAGRDPGPGPVRLRRRSRRPRVVAAAAVVVVVGGLGAATVVARHSDGTDRRTRRPAAGPAATRPAGWRAVSVPVPRSRAVNGRIARGDRVDVLVVTDGVASVGVAGVEVLAVDDAGGGFAAVDRDLAVTLAVDPTQGVRLAEAVAGGAFLLARVGATVGR